MFVISLNNVIGRLHDAACEVIKKEQGSWLSRAFHRTQGIKIENTGIIQGENGKGSVFVGGPGPFRIEATKEYFDSTKNFQKLVQIYLQTFTGDAKINIGDIQVKNFDNKVLKNKLACYYKVDLKTGLKRIEKTASTEKEDREIENRKGNRETPPPLPRDNKSTSDDEFDLASNMSKYSTDKLIGETCGNYLMKDNLWLIQEQDKTMAKTNKRKSPIVNQKYNHTDIEKFIENISEENYVTAKTNLKNILKKKISQKIEEKSV